MTDERLCGVCEHRLHVGRCEARPDGLYCPCLIGEQEVDEVAVEAAPSTDEGEARWLEDARAGLVENFCREVPPCAECVNHLARFEAAIRAPLEEERDRLRKVVGNFDLRIEYADRLLESARWRASRAEAGELRARDVAALLGRTRWEERKARLATEERISDLQRWAEIDHANLEAAEERIRELERGGALFQEVIAALQYDHDQAIEASDTRIRELEAGSERLLKWAREHKHQAEDAFGKISDLEREVERLREALKKANVALNENITTWITLSPMLEEPYPDDPRWTPWTRFGKRAADAAVNAQSEIKRALATPPSSTEGTKEVEG